MRQIITLTLLAVVALLGGCSAKLEGTVDINGQSDAPESCRSGAVYGFRGVELTMKSGVRLRIAATQTGEGELVVAPAGAQTGTRVGSCGPFEISDQNSTINDVKNVQGKAQLDCGADAFKVKGTVSFSNCH